MQVKQLLAICALAGVAAAAPVLESTKRSAIAPHVPPHQVEKREAAPEPKKVKTPFFDEGYQTYYKGAVPDPILADPGQGHNKREAAPEPKKVKTPFFDEGYQRVYQGTPPDPIAANPDHGHNKREAAPEPKKVNLPIFNKGYQTYYKPAGGDDKDKSN